MSDYTKTTDFAAKDALLTGNPAKIVKGTEIDTEFNNIATAIATKVDSTGAVLTTPQINDTTADHQYVFAVSELAADRTVTLPLLTGNDEFVFKDHAATLTNKTVDLTDNTVTGTKAEFNSACSDGDFLFVGDTVGKQTIWVPAVAMIARTTNGAAAGSAESTTNKIMLKTLDFDQTTAEYAQFQIRMPKSWNESTVTAKFSWSSAVSGTNAVVWGLQGVAISDDDALDAAFGTGQTVTDAQTAVGDLMNTAETSAITIGGTPAAEDWVVFQVYRLASDGADTLAGDARLHGVTLHYTTDATTDA